MIRKIAKLSLRSIFSHKMRSFLTMLGIIIGVMAVVILVSITQSATTGITDSIFQHGLPADHRHRHRGRTCPFPGSRWNPWRALAPLRAWPRCSRRARPPGTKRSPGSFTVAGVTPSYFTVQDIAVPERQAHRQL